MRTVPLIGREQFQLVEGLGLPLEEKLSVLADMARANTLSTIKLAGSGHIGSSFSAMDIVSYLFFHHMNTREKSFNDSDRDIFFSSKGHDVPGLYSVMYGLGLLDEDVYIRLRRQGGTPGHPDVSIPGIEANTGSLGMGLSKAKGMAIAKQLKKSEGHIYVLLGDGELGEGQNYEAFQSIVHQGITNITAIIDHNKVQSDQYVDLVTGLGELEALLDVLGWHVERVDGHDYVVLQNVFGKLSKIQNKPKIIIADTIKGRGVSFMEHTSTMVEEDAVYKWHSGAPSDDAFQEGFGELFDRVQSKLKKGNLEIEKKQIVRFEAKQVSGIPACVAKAYGEALVDLGKGIENLFVIDADLADDCQIRSFSEAYPERFLENGIREQDAVSTAGGLAREGFLPVVNSFSSFLSSRANEQIYNNATELTKIIYACHYAGLLPAGPGHSHQSVRDISLFSAMPNMTIVEPATEVESDFLTRYCIEEATTNCMVRFMIGSYPLPKEIASCSVKEFGKGMVLREGKDIVLFTYSPVMIREAWFAAEALSRDGIEVTVINHPWLNHIDTQWLWESVVDASLVVILENHSPRGGLGELLVSKLPTDISSKILGVEGIPACGTAEEALFAHGLRSDQLSITIKEALNDKKTEKYGREMVL